MSLWIDSNWLNIFITVFFESLGSTAKAFPSESVSAETIGTDAEEATAMNESKLNKTDVF